MTSAFLPAAIAALAASTMIAAANATLQTGRTGLHPSTPTQAVLG